MTLKLRIQNHVSTLIANRRRMIKRRLSNRNELDMELKLNKLEYWNANLKSDRAAAQFIINRFDMLKSILPHKQGRLEPDGTDQLRELKADAQHHFQPQQLTIFNQ